MAAQSKLLSYGCLGVVDDTTPELREELIRLLEMLGWDRWPSVGGIKDRHYPLSKNCCYNIFPNKGCVMRSTLETARRGGGKVPIQPITLEHFKWLVEDHLSGGGAHNEF